MNENPNSKLKIEELNREYSEAEAIDGEVFAEQRSNVQLITGDHYARKDSKYWTRIRDSRDLNQEAKIRLTKNHIQKITKTYLNNIISMSPGVRIVPKNDKDIQNMKAAELNQAVWEDLKDKHKLRNKTREWCKDYIDLGEVAVKVFWNPYKGKVIGMKQAVNDDTGEPENNDDGSPMASETPVFSGELEFESVWGFNLLRHSAAKNMHEAKWLCIRKMVPTKDLKAMVGDDPEKLKYINESNDETFIVFDGSRRSYSREKHQCLVREFYWRPCIEYPNGYYAITTKAGVLFEGELPFGIFPIVYTGFDPIQTSPRHMSVVKILRPYQAEVNRTASKIAETQCSFDDKLLVQAGTKITNGGQLPGVRYLQFTGMPPTVMPGNAGDQYLGYLQQQIAEMYDVANLDADSQEKGQTDPFAMLFMSVRDKKKFSVYAEKFEDFLNDVCEVSLELAKKYYTPEILIPAVGKNEYINVSEFQTTTDLCYSIKIEPMSDDIESMMGKQLTINHALQYIGGQLDKKDIGKMLRAMPFGNFDEAYSDLTIDYDSATNMILELDRGGMPQPSQYDDENYMIKRLVGRIRMPDFKQLNPQIQGNYQQIKGQYEQIATQKLQQIQAAEAGFIPSGGARVKVDYYVPDPTNPDRPIRATLPAESVDWLIKRLSDQGSAQDQLSAQNQGAVAEMSQMMPKGGAGPQNPQANMGQVGPMQQ